jgi:cytochrome c biogenesis protein CcmG/thiol:disulfide interchange protein DsbE
MAQEKSNLIRLVPVGIFVAVAAVLAYGLTMGDPSRLPSTLIGKTVPASEFPAVVDLEADGTPVPGFTNTDLAKGKPTIVNFWASWCAQCVDEHPLIERLALETGVDVYGVNYKDTNDAARRYLGRYGNPYSAVGTDAAGRNAINWGVYGMPETFIIDGNGMIVFKQVGPISEDAIKSKLMPAIAEAKARSATAAAAP